MLCNYIKQDPSLWEEKDEYMLKKERKENLKTYEATSFQANKNENEKKMSENIYPPLSHQQQDMMVHS